MSGLPLDEITIDFCEAPREGVLIFLWRVYTVVFPGVAACCTESICGQFMAIRFSSGFEWEADKNESNRKKHQISFEEAAALFEEPFTRIRSDRSGELRWLALGQSQGRIIAVIYTERNGRIRIISARMARKYEREIYKDRIGDTS